MSFLQVSDLSAAQAELFHRSKPLTACYAVHGAADPGLLPRIMAQFAKRGLTPNRLHADLSADGRELVIDVQMAGLGPDVADHIARCLRQVWGVDCVLMSEKAGLSRRTAI